MQFIATLPDNVQRLLENCPASGSGQRLVHRWILELANQLRHFMFGADAAVLIADYISRPPKDREIEDAIRLAYSYPGTIEGMARGAAWPKPRPDFIDSFSAEYDRGKPALELLRVRSKPLPASTADVFAALYEPNTFLCIGHDVRHTCAVRMGKMKRYEIFPLVVPNPLISLGVRQERSIENIRERRFIVIDLDIKPPWALKVLDHWASCNYSALDGQALVLAGLCEQVVNPPGLALVVFSGNVSLQAWFCTLGANREDVAAWFSECCLLGADPAGWITCQWFRMPRARRSDTGRMQEIIYYDPAAVELNTKSSTS